MKWHVAGPRSAFGLIEMLVSIMLFAGVIILGVHEMVTGAKQEKYADTQTKLKELHQLGIMSAKKFEIIKLDAFINAIPELANCFKEQGTQCEKFVEGSVSGKNFPYNAVIYTEAPTILSENQKLENAWLNGAFTLKGERCNANCAIQRETKIVFDCAGKICRGANFILKTSLDKSLLNSEDKALLASIPETQSEFYHDRIKKEGIQKTISSQCNVAYGINFSTNLLTCDQSSLNNPLLFSADFGFHMQNGALVLAQGNPTQAVGNAVCPAGTILVRINPDGTLICSKSVLVSCNPETHIYYFNGEVQSLVFDAALNFSNVLIKVWGAGGGGANGAPGGYAEASYTFPDHDLRLKILVGEGGKNANTQRTFGGGGAGGEDSFFGIPGASGGGFSGVFTDDVSKENALVLAGGGGGGSGDPSSNAGAGGGDSGAAAVVVLTQWDGNNSAGGGTQNAGGPCSNGDNGDDCNEGVILRGGDGGRVQSIDKTKGGGGGGGGGYYGGAGGNASGTAMPSDIQTNNDFSGGGGSGHIDQNFTLLDSHFVTQTPNIFLAPNNSDTDYVTPRGMGGGGNAQNGGDGLVIVEAQCPTSE